MEQFDWLSTKEQIDWPNVRRQVTSSLYIASQRVQELLGANIRYENVLFNGEQEIGSIIVREPAILLIKWLRPKGLKVCSYVEKYAVLKNQTLKKFGWYTKMLCTVKYPGGRQFLKLALKWGTLYHRN